MTRPNISIEISVSSSGHLNSSASAVLKLNSTSCWKVVGWKTFFWFAERGRQLVTFSLGGTELTGAVTFSLSTSVGVVLVSQRRARISLTNLTFLSH